MNAPDKKEIDAYLDRVKNLTKVDESGVFRVMDMSAPDPGNDPRIQIDKRAGLVVLYYKYPYEIELKRIRGYRGLLQ